MNRFVRWFIRRNGVGDGSPVCSACQQDLNPCPNCQPQGDWRTCLDPACALGRTCPTHHQAWIA